MSIFTSFVRQVDLGREGRHRGIRIMLPVYNNIVNGIQRKAYTLVGGNTGTGKTAFVDYAYVLLPMREWMKDESGKPDFRIIYFSMERSREFKIAKWICALLYLDHRIVIDTRAVLSQGGNGRLDDGVYEKIMAYRGFFDSIENRLVILDGRQKPKDVARILRNHAAKYGTFTIDAHGEESYTPASDEVVMVVIDHIGKVRRETRVSEKESIDELSGVMGDCRDILGYAPVVIQQFNRDVADPNRMKMQGFEPRLEDFKGSANTQEDCDIALTLFNPFRYGLMNYGDYQIDKFVDGHGRNRFRSIKVLKNSYGDDDVSVGMNFIGECGLFKEMPRPRDMRPEHYKAAINP